jgi:hypothetical protein
MKQGRRIRYSLGAFLLTAGILGSVAGFYLRFRYHVEHGTWHERNLVTTKGSDYKLYVMWLSRRDRRRLLYVLAIPWNISDYSLSVGGSLEASTLERGISQGPSGLFFDGAKLPTEPPRIVYIFTARHTMQFVDGLSADEILQIQSIEDATDLTELDLWDQKVVPLIDEEFGKARAMRLRRLRSTEGSG